MNKHTVSTTVRTCMAAAVCASLVLLPALRISFANAGPIVADLKTESTVRTEASLYAGAIRAIAGIASMNLGDKDQLKKALAIVERERPNLKFSRSNRIVLGLGESTFANAVKKRSPDKASAAALIKEVIADPKAVLKLDGAQSLVTRIQKSNESDGAVLRLSAERLKEAAGKLKQGGQAGARSDVAASEVWKVMPASYTAVPQPSESIQPPQDPFTILVIVGVVLFYAEVAYFGYLYVKDLVTQQEGRDAVAECQDAVDARYARCISAARTQPFPLDAAAAALCYSEWLVASAGCLVSP